jgi:hypothetical protein
MHVLLDLRSFAACTELWGRLATCGRLLIGLLGMTRRVCSRLGCPTVQVLMRHKLLPSPWRGHSCPQECLPRRDFRFADPCRASRRLVYCQLLRTTGH